MNLVGNVSVFKPGGRSFTSKGVGSPVTVISWSGPTGDQWRKLLEQEQCREFSPYVWLMRHAYFAEDAVYESNRQ